MNITTVQIISEGYLVNGKYSVPNDEGNADYQSVQKWIVGGNTPSPLPAPSDAKMKEDIKLEARRRILTVYPEWKQANMTARAVELNKIHAHEGGWTPSEQTEMAALESVWAWIKSVRAASDALEVTLPANYKDDEHWPA